MLKRRFVAVRLGRLTKLVGILGGLLSACSGAGRWSQANALSLGDVDLRPQWGSAWVKDAIANDPAAKAIVSDYLSGLATAGYEPSQQGVWVSVGQYSVADNQGTVPTPAASLTKIATTLAALSTWEPNHRFETLAGWQGQFDVSSGVITGDLVIEGGSDPLFVWEEAIALGNALQQAGVRRVTGDLVIANGFNMNFEPSSSQAGVDLKQALNASNWEYALTTAYQNLPPGTPTPQIQIDGDVQTDAGSRKTSISGWLVRHDSLPLVAVLKAMNIYSNNPMAEQIANAVGGPSAVVSKVETAADVAPGELKLINGSGLGEANQMSPRAAVMELQAIQRILRSHSYTISDIFPVTGADGGTVSNRGLPANSVVKTGSLAVVSALAGVVPTEERGLVWFSLMNYGAGLDALRSRQDQIISALEQQWGKASGIPPELKTTVVIGQTPYQFGNPERNFSMLNQ
ncbi:MAG: D-alanyl-D-alanine carboxypeptidase [Phormidesmis sp.]